MSKVLMVIAKNIFRDEEFQVPYDKLKENNFEVVVASSSMGTAKGKLGAEVEVEAVINEINTQDFDAVIFVGGSGVKEYWDNPAAHRIALDLYNSGKIVAAICSGSVVLANSGLLANKKATSWHENSAQLEQAKAIYTGNPVEIEGNIITGNGPQAAEEFVNRIIEKLN